MAGIEWIFPIVGLALLALSFINFRPAFPVAPGAWFREYTADFIEHFDITQEEMTSAVIEGTHGYIWTTQTPEWDRDWFERHGYSFPKRWVPFEILEDYYGPPGTPVRLDA